MKRRYWYLLIVLVQVILCYLAFPFHFEHGFDSSFCNDGDGMKNNFTLIQFVKEPIGEKGIFHFDFFQYPHGDYVYTADNTPAYAVSMRWINHHLFNVESITIPLFNILMIGNFVLCALLLFSFGRKYIRNDYWLFGLAILLPFFLEQSLRLARGHYNLSLSSIFALGFILCRWYAERSAAGRPVSKVLLSMLLLAVAGFLIHGYYLPILTVLFAFFLLVFHLKAIVSGKGWKQILLPVGLVIMIGITSFSIMKVSDGFFDIRQQHAQLYNINDQKLSPSYLFQSYSWNTISFPLRTHDFGSYVEPHMYLGHAFWALFILILLLALLHTAYRRNIFIALQSVRYQPLLISLLIAVGVLLAISMGDSFFSHQIRLHSIRFLNMDVDHLSVNTGIALLGIVLSAAAFAYLLLAQVRRAKLRNNWQKKDMIQFIIVVLVISWFVVFYFTNIIQFRYIPNLVNPFYYLRKITRIVEQFRSLSRFAWPFSMFISGILVYVHVRASSGLNKGMRVAVAAIVLSLGASQLSDWISHMRSIANHGNLFSQHALQAIPEYEASRYAATFPVPAFMVGSEDYNVTIDDFDNFSKWMYQFTYKNQIPMMSSKLSRTPVAFADQVMDILLNRQIVNPVLALLPDKPVLVVVSKEYMEQKPDEVLAKVRYPDIQQKAFEANKAQFEFLKNPELKWIKTEGQYDFYEWYVK